VGAVSSDIEGPCAAAYTHRPQPLPNTDREDSNWEPDGVTHLVRFYEGSGTYRSLALDCARLREPTRDAGLSLGARTCLALGKRLFCPVLTTDRSWREVAVGMKVQLARP
jgi:hypothetical protein